MERQPSTHGVIVIGGGALLPQAIERVPSAPATIIAADSGLDHAIAAGLRPDTLVGDLDSISAAGRMWAYAHELSIDEYSSDKDATDTEIAIARAVAQPGLEHLLLLGGLETEAERRLDHLLGTILALGHPALAALTSVRAILGATELVVLHPGRSAELALDEGQTFSLFALHGACSGVNLSGAKWPLVDAALTSTEARGVSNLSSSDPLTVVSVATGVLTVVIP